MTINVLPLIEAEHIKRVMEIMRVTNYNNVVAWWNAFQKAFAEAEKQERK